MADLTKREKAILRYLMERPIASNQDIAGYFNRSRRTVENQLLTLYKKLKIEGSNQRFQLALKAEDILAES